MKQLEKEEFNKFFKEYSDMVYGTRKSADVSTSLRTLFDKYGLDVDIPDSLQAELNPALDTTVTGVAEKSRGGCSACAGCALCTFCGEANALSGAIGLAGLVGLA